MDAKWLYLQLFVSVARLAWLELRLAKFLTPSPPLSLSGEAAAFDEEWRSTAGRYPPPNARGIDYGRDRRAGGQQLALAAPPSSSSPPAPRHESPRHLPPATRPRYDW